MTGAISIRLRASIVLLGFLALMQGVSICTSEKKCYQLRLDTFTSPCAQRFSACLDGPLDTIHVTNATVTVTSLIDPDNQGLGSETHTANATEAANSIVHCNTYTCESLAYILIANYSTQYCIGAAAGSHPPHLVYIHAVVSVKYTGGTHRPFNSEFNGYFKSGYYRMKECQRFKLQSNSTRASDTTTSLRATTNRTDPLPHLTFACSENMSTTLSSTREITTALSLTHIATTPSSSTTYKTTASASRLGVTLSTPAPDITPSPSETHGATTPCTLQSSTTEVTSLLSPTHEDSTPLSTPLTTTASPSTGGTTLSTPTPDITPSETHEATTLQLSTTEACRNVVSEKVSDGVWAGNHTCGSTFTFHFSSLNMRNLTVQYAYTNRGDIVGGATNVQLSNSDNEVSNVSIISSVIDIVITDGNKVIRLTDGSVEITFEIEPAAKFTPQDGSSLVHCAYLVNESTWSTDGLHVISNNSDSVVCNSSHLTSFAVLLSVKPPEGINAEVQSYLSYMFGAISIASLALAVLIYCATGVYKMLKIQIHMNLAISTALGQLLFLTMASATGNRALCKGVTVTLHYLFTAALAWTIIEGVFLYRTTAVGFKPLKIAWLSLMAWGGSLLVVGVSFGILFDTYGTREYCWLYAGDKSIYIFAGCVFATEMFNFMVLWFVMRTFSSLKANKKKDEIDKIKATVRALFILLPILGLTWIAGTFTSITESDAVIVFQYIFLICFCLQGVCFLVFHCLLVPDVKAALKLRLNRRVTDSSWGYPRSSKETKSTDTSKF